MGGAERLLAVLAELFPEAPIYTLLYDESKVGQFFSAGRVRPSMLQKLPAWLRRPQLLLPWIPQAVEAWDFDEFDIVISSSSAFAHGIVTSPSTRHICYCHSPARFLWDYAHRYLAERRISGLRELIARPLLTESRIWNRLAAKRVDRWIANSAAVAARIGKFYRAPAEVVYPPVSFDRVKFSRHSENYFLIVSQLAAYKRIDLAVSVFNKLRRRLVVVGEGPQLTYLRALAGPTVEILGWQSDESVRELVANCRGFLFPGEDDFGIAPVEAQAAGKPVLAFARGGALETVRPGVSGELFSEQTHASFESGLARLLANESSYKPERIRRHAKQFEESVFREKMRELVAEEWASLQKIRAKSDPA